MDTATEGYRRAFSEWPRTGRPADPNAADSVERKFNPYHDPRDGRFTFAPSGSRSLRQVVMPARNPPNPSRNLSRPLSSAVFSRAGSAGHLNDGVFRPNGMNMLQQTQYRPRPPRSIGDNGRAFLSPMTLEQAFPGLRDSPSGALVALADNIFDFSGPARKLTTDLSLGYSQILVRQIEAIDPNNRFQSFGFPETFEGQMNQIAGLRLDLARAFYQKRGEMRPLQVETLRFVQRRTDFAYAEGLRLYEEGRLNPRLSRDEAIGNHVDGQVRRELPNLYGRLGISTARNEQVRVNSREYDTSGSDSTYRLPDARVGKVVFDWTTTRKTPGLAQVRGYFNADLKPDIVIIVRPSQLGPQSSYAITRPRN